MIMALAFSTQAPSPPRFFSQNRGIALSGADAAHHTAWSSGSSGPSEGAVPAGHLSKVIPSSSSSAFLIPFSRSMHFHDVATLLGGCPVVWKNQVTLSEMLLLAILWGRMDYRDHW